MQFIDEVKIFVQAGKGGDGAKSFRREKYIPFGGPDGGNGGAGGSVIIYCNKNINTLVNFRGKKRFIAQNGTRGSGNRKNGKAGEDLIIYVPIGTQIIDFNTKELLYDMIEHEDKYIVCQGGRGGIGNHAFKSSRNRSPYQFTCGLEGDELDIILSLKVLSDVGLVGLPNAGKSTLINSVSHANAKVANYPFTTMSPILGMVEYKDTEFTMADIPGLIKGAHLGKGLGHIFLKHIERCSLLVHVLDVNSNNILEDYFDISNEIEKHSIILQTKQRIICLNKTDLIDDNELEMKIQMLKNNTNEEIICVSAINRQNTHTLIQKISEILFKN